jgi:uncharacterized protein YuzE
VYLAGRSGACNLDNTLETESLDSMPSLVEALPDLVSDIENALIRIGRGDVARQLREVTLQRWTYDEFADAGYLYLASARISSVVGQDSLGAKHAETLCPSDDLAVNLDLDSHRRLTGIELLAAKSIISRLEKNI